MEEQECELTPILGEKTKHDEDQASQESGNEKLQESVKGIICAFIWAFLCASSRISVQAIENR